MFFWKCSRTGLKMSAKAVQRKIPCKKNIKKQETFAQSCTPTIKPVVFLIIVQNFTKWQEDNLDRKETIPFVILNPRYEGFPFFPTLMLVHTLDNFIRIYCHINANTINNTTNNSFVFKYHAKNVSVFKFSVYEIKNKKVQKKKYL